MGGGGLILEFYSISRVVKIAFNCCSSCYFRVLIIVVYCSCQFQYLNLPVSFLLLLCLVVVIVFFFYSETVSQVYNV